jgi:DNA-binding transcriptional MerR regulator
MDDFRALEFTPAEVKEATGLDEANLRNWLTRGQIDLDANRGRQERKRRLFSPRDVLILAVAARLSNLHFPITALTDALKTIDRMVAPSHPGAPMMFADRRYGPPLAANIPSFILVNAEGEVFGPYGDDFDMATAPDAFAVLRMDSIIREVLEPLGVSITDGTAGDLRAAADRIDAAKASRKRRA